MSKETPKPPIMSYEDDGKNIRSLCHQAGMDNNLAERDKPRFTTEKLEEMERKLSDEKVGGVVEFNLRRIEKRELEGRDMNSPLGLKDAHKLESALGDINRLPYVMVQFCEDYGHEYMLDFKDWTFSEFKNKVDELKQKDLKIGSIVEELYNDTLETLWNIDN